MMSARTMLINVTVISFILILVLIIARSGYTPPPPPKPKNLIGGQYISEFTYDGCQYIYFGTLGFDNGTISHKGNCTNKFHKENQ
jgi:hypothetical protein